MSIRPLPLIALCLGFFMVILDVTIVNVALPTLAQQFDGKISILQWIVDGYTLTFASFLLTAGCLGEQWGAKKAFLSGLIIFIFASLGCGLSTGFVMLIFFRFIQGIGAALVVPTSLTLIHNQYEHQQQRARAIGIWAGLGGVAAAAGPVLGAFLTSSFGWRAVFLVNIPIGLTGIALTLKYIARSQGRRTKKFDFQGLFLAMTSIVSLAYALIEVGQYGWFSAHVVTGMVVAVMAFILFVYVETRHPFPLFPLELFKSSSFSVAIVIGVILNIGMYGELFVLPLYFQNIQKYSVLETGFAILPLLSLIAIASYFAGQWIGRVGTKIPMIVGLAIGAFGFFLLLIVGDHSLHYIDLVFPMAAIGFGTAFTMPAATLAAIQGTPEGRAGLASSAFNTSRQIGSLIGVAVFGSIISSSTSFVLGMQMTLILGGLLFFWGSILAKIMQTG